MTRTTEGRGTIPSSEGQYTPPDVGAHQRSAPPAPRPRIARIAFGDDEELEKDLITFRLGFIRK